MKKLLQLAAVIILFQGCNAEEDQPQDLYLHSDYNIHGCVFYPDGSSDNCFAGTINKLILLPVKPYYIIRFQSNAPFNMTYATKTGNVYREILLISKNNQVTDTVFYQ